MPLEDTVGSSAWQRQHCLHVFLFHPLSWSGLIHGAPLVTGAYIRGVFIA